MDISTTHNMYLEIVDIYTEEFLNECKILNCNNKIGNYTIESFMSKYDDPKIAAKVFAENNKKNNMTDAEETRIKYYIEYFESVIEDLEDDIETMSENKEKYSDMIPYTQGQIYMLKKVCSKLHNDIIPF